MSIWWFALLGFVGGWYSTPLMMRFKWYRTYWSWVEQKVRGEE